MPAVPPPTLPSTPRPAGARAPAPDDAVLDWLDPRQARRLAAAGLPTLRTLMGWIATRGFHWQRSIAGIGAGGAAGIVQWLRAHEATLGALPGPALVAPGRIDTGALTPPPRSGIVPLERFRPPAGCDGAQGTNRAPLAQCTLAVADDVEAVQAWLALRVAGSHTWRAYRKEAERWLLWAVLARRKALSSLAGDDCRAYQDFLAAPPPAWTAPRKTQRWSEAWRPFEGPLAPRSQATALAIVRALCGWLVRRRYLDRNPWDAVPPPGAAAARPALRALSPRQWERVQAWLDAQAPCPALRRLRLMLGLAYLSGLRRSELVASRVGWLRQAPSADGVPTWSIGVPGAPGRWREVPLPDAAVRALREHFVDRGLCADLQAHPADAPLIARLGQNAPLSAARLYEVLVAAFERCAADLAARDPQAAQRIRQASTHWLRHSHGAHAAARGVPPQVLQARLGHRSPASTAVYLAAADRPLATGLPAPAGH